jgi:Zn-dependent peptidase ImmA (M78 family)
VRRYELLYEKLLIEADNEGLKIYERDIGNLKGLYVDGNVALSPTIETLSEKACVLAEELGHYYTTFGNILDQNKIENRKQERRARGWAYERLVSLESLITASKQGIRNRYELAEFLGVSERFIEEAMKYYKDKHGTFYETDAYIVYFEPLGVLEKL